MNAVGLRRPLVLVACSFALLLSLLASWGALEPGPTSSRARKVGLDGVVASGCVETRIGDRILVESAAPIGRVEAFVARGSCDALEPRPGQGVRLAGSLRPPRAPKLPGDFDERAAAAGLGASWVFRGSARIVERRVPIAWRPWAIAEALRRSSERAFRRWLGGDDARLMEGLLFGMPGALDRDVKRTLQDAGVIHLFVPSGAKAAWVGALLAGAGGAGPPGWPAAILACAALALFCLMAGPHAPYLRASVAVAAGLAAVRRPERDWGGIQAIALSATGLLAWRPRLLLAAGFQMTYAAALAIWWSAPWRRWSRWPAAAAWVLRVAFVSVVVQAALWPILADVFGRASLAGSLANVLLVPAAPAAAASGLLLWTVSSVPALAAPASWLAAASLHAMMGAASWFARLPWAAVELSPLPKAGVLAWYLAAAGALALPRPRPALALLGLAAGVCLFSAAWSRGIGPRLELCFLASRGRSALWEHAPDGRRLWVQADLPPYRLRAAGRALGGADPPAAEPAELRFGELRLSLAESPGVALLRRRGTDAPIYCILRRSDAVAPPQCAPAVIRGMGREGALWVITDGHRYQVGPAEAGRPLARPVL